MKNSTIRFAAFCISFSQSPLSMMGSPIPCLADVFVHHLLIYWNRLVPVAIAALRYVMVCHAVFVNNHGGEKMVRCLFSYSEILKFCKKKKKKKKKAENILTLAHQVWKFLISILSLLSVAVCTAITSRPERVHSYLYCMGRQERFR